MARRRGPARGPDLPHVRAPAIRSRGPLALQRALLAQPRETENIPRPQQYLGTESDGPGLRQVIAAGTEPEWRIFWALMTMGLRPDQEFFYQSAAFGGRQRFGGAVLDFTLPFDALALNVNGTVWHNRTTGLQGADRLLRARMAGQGVLLIFLDEPDCMRRPRAIVQMALQRQDVSVLAHAG